MTRSTDTDTEARTMILALADKLKAYTEQSAGDPCISPEEHAQLVKEWETIKQKIRLP